MTQDPSSLVLFGGTFDPVHHGHLIVARAVAEQKGLEKVVFVPTARPPHKEGPLATALQRLEMLKLAVAGQPHLGVSDVELRRGGQRSYTIDTVSQLQAENPSAQIWLIVGADMLADLPNWHRAGELIEQVGILSVGRPGWQDRSGRCETALTETFGGSRARQILADAVEAPLIEISSTDVRRRVGQGRSIRWLVPEAVESYIAREGLYRQA